MLAAASGASRRCSPVDQTSFLGILGHRTWRYVVSAVRLLYPLHHAMQAHEPHTLIGLGLVPGTRVRRYDAGALVAARNVEQEETSTAAVSANEHLSSLLLLRTSSFCLTADWDELRDDMGHHVMGASPACYLVSVGSVLVGNLETAAPALDGWVLRAADSERLGAIPPRVGA